MATPDTHIHSPRLLPYRMRLIVVSAVLALATLLVLLTAPRQEDVRVADIQPTGEQVPATIVIRVQFARPVERISAERAFVLYPPAPGRFRWEDERTLIYTPLDPLTAGTRYRVTIRPGLRDLRGRINRTPVSWPFRVQP